MPTNPSDFLKYANLQMAAESLFGVSQYRTAWDTVIQHDSSDAGIGESTCKSLSDRAGTALPSRRLDSR